MSKFKLDPEAIKSLRKRGRPAKIKMTLEEQEDAVILKYLNGEPMTLEETALAMWMNDGRPKGGPMTRMGVLKLEQRACAKLRKACEAAGIGPEILQMFGTNCKRTSATRSHNAPAEY
jgi:hypothetical protein